jgi:hypothetical protein
MASRTSFITMRIPQVPSPWQSEHGWYADWLTQGIGARGPSMSRTICPMVMVFAGCARK